MSNLDKLKNLKASAGLAKCPVVCTEREARALLAKLATPDSIIELFDQLQVAQQRIAEITGKYEEVSGWYAKMKTRMLAAEAELARRDATAGEPYAYEFVTSGKKQVILSRVLPPIDTDEVIKLYTAAQPTALPPEDYFSSIVFRARQSAEKAMVKFPQPNYVLLKVAEKAGEVVQAGFHYAEGSETWEELEGEVVQAIAMLYRLVIEGDLVNGVIPPERLTVEGDSDE